MKAEWPSMALKTFFECLCTRITCRRCTLIAEHCLRYQSCWCSDAPARLSRSPGSQAPPKRAGSAQVVQGGGPIDWHFVGYLLCCCCCWQLKWIFNSVDRSLMVESESWSSKVVGWANEIWLDALSMNIQLGLDIHWSREAQNQLAKESEATTLCNYRKSCCTNLFRARFCVISSSDWFCVVFYGSSFDLLCAMFNCCSLCPPGSAPDPANSGRLHNQLTFQLTWRQRGSALIGLHANNKPIWSDRVGWTRAEFICGDRDELDVKLVACLARYWHCALTVSGVFTDRSRSLHVVSVGQLLALVVWSLAWWV